MASPRGPFSAAELAALRALAERHADDPHARETLVLLDMIAARDVEIARLQAEVDTMRAQIAAARDAFDRT